jgi:hypothetical protein
MIFNAEDAGKPESWLKNLCGAGNGSLEHWQWQSAAQAMAVWNANPGKLGILKLRFSAPSALTFCFCGDVFTESHRRCYTQVGLEDVRASPSLSPHSWPGA